MATATKFTFDLDFDAPEESLQPEPVEEEAEAEEEEAVPTFSEEDLAQARAEGYEAGKEDGRMESAEATEQRILETVESATGKLADIFNDQAQANHDIAQEMIEISTVIAKKMFPDLNSRNALGEVERVVQDTLKAITDEPRVQIMVHPDLREPLTDRLAAMTQRAGFEGKVYVNPDTTISLGDCRVEWSHGAAVRDSETTLAMIDEIITRNLHGDGPVIANVDGHAAEDSEPEAVEPEMTSQEPGIETTSEADLSAKSEAENVESTEPDVESEPHEPVEVSASDDVEATNEESASEVTDMTNEHFAPSESIDDDLSTLSAPSDNEENQQVEDVSGEAPIPHVALDQEPAAKDATEPEQAPDEPRPTVNSDPVSPDMTAAILDAQGAISEEEEN